MRAQFAPKPFLDCVGTKVMLQHGVGELDGHGVAENRLPPSFLHLHERSAAPASVDLAVIPLESY